MILDIMSYEPSESHYRREHAPLARYLPSDLNKHILYNRWKARRIEMVQKPGSFTLYRNMLKKLNVRFVKKKQEECEDCLEFFLHEKESNHSRQDLNENTTIECQQCRRWYLHIQDAGKSRALYQEYKYDISENSIAVAADLEKVRFKKKILIHPFFITPLFYNFSNCFLSLYFIFYRFL